MLLAEVIVQFTHVIVDKISD